MFKKGYKMSEEHKRKIGKANAISHIGLKQTPEHVAKRTAKIIGNKWNVGRKQSSEHILKRILANTGKKRSAETKRKISIANKGKKCPWAKPPIIRGADNHLWRGGITPENYKIRMSLEMKLWKKACLERDNFTCQKTGERGGRLIIHHINNFADFPELRTTINNGITLSEKTHKNFHKKYGVKNNTLEQLKEFLALK